MNQTGPIAIGGGTIVNFEQLRLTTGSGDDVITTLVNPTLRQDDVIRSGAGHDRITVGGYGLDYVDGGLGDDLLTIDYSGFSGVVTNTGVYASRGLVHLGQRLGRGLHRNRAVGHPLRLGRRRLRHPRRRGSRAGRRGNDKVDARGGDDVVDGGAGADTLTGGLGRDTVAFDSAATGRDRIPARRRPDRQRRRRGRRLFQLREPAGLQLQRHPPGGRRRKTSSTAWRGTTCC
jgi:hypothetical protein